MSAKGKGKDGRYQGRGGRGGRGGGGHRGGGDPDVTLSRSLSYILRHGAGKEGIPIRSDGYVKLDDLLRKPRFHGVTLEKIKEIVETNDKQRYTLLFEPSNPQASSSGNQAVPVELPSAAEAPEDEEGTWYIRANQGHSIKVEALDLTPVTDAAQVPVAIHGTNWAAWRKIATKGLSIMARNHIHIAAGKPGASGVLSGMRSSSDIYIYINIAKALEANIPFFISSNTVILTPGDSEGFLLKEFFEKVETRDGKPVDDSWRQEAPSGSTVASTS